MTRFHAVLGAVVSQERETEHEALRVTLKQSKCAANDIKIYTRPTDLGSRDTRLVRLNAETVTSTCLQQPPIEARLDSNCVQRSSGTFTKKQTPVLSTTSDNNNYIDS